MDSQLKLTSRQEPKYSTIQNCCILLLLYVIFSTSRFFSSLHNSNNINNNNDKNIQIKGVAHILSKTAGCSQIVCMIFIGMASETVRLAFIIIK